MIDEDKLEFIDIEEDDDEFELMHYGVGHLDGGNSGRYPWGSGDDKYQHYSDFLARVRELRKEASPFTDNRKTIKKNGKEIPNKDYGKTFTGETAVAKIMGLDTTEYRNAVTLAKNLERMGKVNRAQALANEVDENGKPKYGMSEIARKMGLPNESSVRSLLEPQSIENMLKAQETANLLKDRLAELTENDPKAMIDIGPGSERYLNVTRKKLDDAVYILEGEGYKTGGSRIPNITDPTGARQTTLNVLGNPTMSTKDPYDFDHIYSVQDYITRDNGKTFERKFEFPASLDSKRLKIRYNEEGGIEKDGLIELRRGVPDLSLGESNFAQVRILVDGDRYLKGMAAYSDNMPDGVDVVFNTNKKLGTPMRDVLKTVNTLANGEIDRDNPFGSLIKDKNQGGQYHYYDEKGQKHLGLINKRADEGDWDDWKDSLSSQFLSKQTLQLAQRQLNLAVKDKQQEFQEILNLNNNTVKKAYLETFASDCDSSAVHLKAAALPRQKFQVILPLPSLKDDQIYAPNYKDGEKVALVRYPHGGTFEIPILTVNNKSREGAKLIGKNSVDAVGINANVAARLSGADFDGDTVMVIPTNDKIKIKTTRIENYPGLVGFDPKTDYGPARIVHKEESSDGKDHYYNAQGKEYKIMTQTNLEMGKISNLITDMTIIGASPEEIARAVKHSMVVIDAAKHKLDYKSSEQQNKITQLKKKYQGKLNENGKETYGAATLISGAKSQVNITKTQGQGKINIKGTPYYDPTRPEGALIYNISDKAVYRTIKDPTTGRNANVYENKDGSLYYYSGTKDNKTKVEIKDTRGVETHIRTERSTRMEQTDDANDLVSPYRSPMERVYAAYANTMKSLANEARKTLFYTKGVEYSPSAAKIYKDEVEQLGIDLDKAQKNKPRERQAQIIATSNYNAKVQANPDMTKEEQKKLRQQEISKARDMVGARRERIKITDREWEAIQAGAIHSSKLEQILNYVDMDTIRDRATPKEFKVVTDAKLQRMKSYADAGRTNAEIASILGLSTSTVAKYLNPKNNNSVEDDKED